MTKLDDLALHMITYYAADPARIQHFIKVHSFAALIARQEGMDAATLEILEAAAYVHDIGIKPAEQTYGSSAGRYQEELGPAPARAMMLECGFTPAQATALLIWWGTTIPIPTLTAWTIRSWWKRISWSICMRILYPKQRRRTRWIKFSKRRQAKRSAKKCLCCKRYYDEFFCPQPAVDTFPTVRFFFATAPAGTIKPPKQNPTTQERTLTMIFADKLIALRKRQDIPRKNLPNS